MKLLDELNSVVKTPDEVEKIRIENLKKDCLSAAHNLFNKLCDCLKTAANEGKYETENGEKVIRVYYMLPNPRKSYYYKAMLELGPPYYHVDYNGSGLLSSSISITYKYKPRYFFRTRIADISTFETKVINSFVYQTIMDELYALASDNGILIDLLTQYKNKHYILPGKFSVEAYYDDDEMPTDDIDYCLLAVARLGK